MKEVRQGETYGELDKTANTVLDMLNTEAMTKVRVDVYKRQTLAQIMQVLDGLIVVAGASVFGIRSALYALIAIFCVAKVTDGLIEGLKFSKQAYIISQHYREIAEAIMEQMGRGVTSLEARGMYLSLIHI